MFKMKAILAVAVTALSLGACADELPQGLPPDFTSVPVPQDASWAVEWWGPRHEEKMELAKHTDVDLLFVGDSITHGWESDGAAVWDEFYGDRNAFNIGFGGDRTEHVLWRLDNGAVDGMQPSLAVVMIGTNNTGHRMDPAVFTAGAIESIVGKLRALSPETRVLVLGIFPRNVSPYNDMRRRNDEINALLAGLDDGEHVFYLDIGAAYLTEDGTLRAELMPDLLHPNAEGYRVWAEAMEPTLERLLQ